MNENDKKRLIIISSAFLLVLVFMVFFTLYRQDAILSDRTYPKINTDTVDPNDLEGPVLGDNCGTRYSCSNGTTPSLDHKCCPVGYDYENGRCDNGTEIMAASNAQSSLYCTSCDAGKYLSSTDKCIYCPSGSYCPGDTDTYHELPQNSYGMPENASHFMGFGCNAGYYKDGGSCKKC